MQAIQSALMKLNSNDLIKGGILVVIVSVLDAIQQGLTVYGLNFAAYNWISIEQVALTAGVGYLVKNLLTNSNGSVLGLTAATTPPPATQ